MNTITEFSLLARVYNACLACLLLTLVVCTSASGQSLDIDLVANTHSGGYHIRCFGGTDGNISSVVTGGTAPYTYSWSSGATTEELEDVGAGNYTLTVTDNAGATASETIELTQPSKLEIVLDPHLYPGGTHISEAGASDGAIETVTLGGTPPYTYAWADGQTTEKRRDVPAGNYSVTVSDASGCSFTADVSLTEPVPLVLSLNAAMNGGSWNLTCFRSADGSIDATVSGGIAPYTFDWSHGAFTEDASGLDAAEYTLRVSDMNGATVQSTVTLTEPDQVEVTVSQTEYPNGFNVSCHNCFNGLATASASGGTGSFSYEWEDGVTTNNRNDLGLDSYRLTVLDGNGCRVDETVDLRIPTRDDWTMNGNEIEPQQFIGSTNEADVEFRANNQPQLRLGADGTTELLGGVKMLNPGSEIDETTVAGVKYVVADPDGQLLIMGSEFHHHMDDAKDDGCFQNGVVQDVMGSWKYDVNKIYSCPAVNVGIGTRNPEEKLDVIGTAQARNLNLKNGGNELAIYAGGLFKPGDWPGAGAETKLSLGDGHHYIKSVFDQGLSLGTYQAADALVIEQGSGKVGINVGLDHTFGDGQLEVNGMIRTREAVVEIVGWPDYVFEDTYELRPLSEVDEYIKRHGHLPDVPPAAEVEKNGANLGDMDKLLLQKVEELTLYVIDLQKQNDELKAELNDLKIAE